MRKRRYKKQNLPAMQVVEPSPVCDFTQQSLPTLSNDCDFASLVDRLSIALCHIDELEQKLQAKEKENIALDDTLTMLRHEVAGYKSSHEGVGDLLIHLNNAIKSLNVEVKNLKQLSTNQININTSLHDVYDKFYKRRGIFKRIKGYLLAIKNFLTPPSLG